MTGIEPTGTRVDLVRAAQRGDLEAFAELVRQERRTLVMAARTLIGDFHEAEDAAHEALVSAYRGLAGLRDPRAFGPWLSRILNRAAERRRRALARQVPTEDLSRVPAPSGDRDDRPERVLRETARLPEKYRVLLMLFYIREHSYREVAAITGQSEKRVKSRLFAAREMLRRRLGDAD